MNQTGRICLREGQILELQINADDPKTRERYQIRSVVGEGGSSVCYEAIRERDGMPGKLKEFYPIDAAAGNQRWYYSLERLENGQLIPRGGTIRRFHEMCQDYLNAYFLLTQVMVENPKNQVLKNYIQNSDVLYGCPENGTSATVYIWSAGFAGRNFDEYLLQVREHPEIYPDVRLHEILCAVIALTDGIKAVHTAGLLHLDIKPSNFLVPYDSDGRINAASISIFDINTLYSIYGSSPMVAGTDGYRAPEVLRGKADNRSDIYSIGALLFYAIVISENIPGDVYHDSYYEDLNQLVRHSRLITGSESNSDVNLMARLAKILRKCLAKQPGKRYQSCSELKKDLEKARLRSGQYAVKTGLLGQNKKLAIVDAVEEGINDPTIVIQKLLYDHPLYESLKEGQKEIHVLTVGSGTYGQKFIDQCMQAGQMKDFSLHIRAISRAPEEDQENYLQFRPELSRFVNIDDSMKGQEERAYATLEFAPLIHEQEDLEEELPKEFLRGRTEAAAKQNRKLIENMMDQASKEGFAYDYVFVSLGSQTLNQSIAGAFTQVLTERDISCPVCYISSRNTRRKLQNKLYAVNINEKITPETISPQLEQMAFNADLSWNSSLNLDIHQALEIFRKDVYRYRSSLAYALSIRYKLFSIGIETEDPYQEAEHFDREVLQKMETDPEAQKKFRTLVALEHRRWVLDRVTEGWTAPRNARGELDLKGCVESGMVRNNQKSTHPCLVFSTEEMPLCGEAYERDGRAKWEDPNIDPSLDELDRMSVRLHQCFQQKADEFRGTGPLQGEDLEAIRSYVGECGEDAKRAFRQFRFCLKNMLDGVESYTRQYGHYEDNLKKAVKNTVVEERICDRLKLIRKAFKPVEEANLYRNYKSYDETLVRKIPFILTYQFMPELAMAFEDGSSRGGNNESVFADVASATLLSPKKICYLYDFREDSDEQLMLKKLKAVLHYLGQREVHCTINMAITCRTDVTEARKQGLCKALDEIIEYELMECESSGQAVAKQTEYLRCSGIQLYDGSTALFPSMLDNGKLLSGILQAKIPYFELDWRRKRFTETVGCEYLRYMEDDSSIRIEDMFALMNAADQKPGQPEFADDYEILWRIYSGEYLSENGYENAYEQGVESWNHLCACLRCYEEAQRPLAEFWPGNDPDEEQRAKQETLVFMLPIYVFKTVKDLMDELIRCHVIGAASRVTAHSGENCRVEIQADGVLEAKFAGMFAQPHLLMPYYGVQVKHVQDPAGERIVVSCSDPAVHRADMDPFGKGWQESVYRVLEQLQQKHYISGLIRDGERCVNFTYNSPRMRRLLTSEAELLKIYTYYQVLKTGYFDDVACGYEFSWESGEVENELDLVMTKGFRSMILECKAEQELDSQYYYKLHSIAEHFGIGTVKVLIGNTYRRNDRFIENENAVHRSRGAQLNIVTVSDEAEITNIGQKLMQIMQGR